MDPAVIEAALLAASHAVRDAGAIARAHFRTRPDVANKASTGFDPVTEADRGIERHLRAALLPLLPGIGLVGEEFGITGNPHDYWIIDPIDGTRSFISGMLGWGILAGLVLGRQPVAGLMHQPITGETFLATPATGARVLGPGHAAPLATSPIRRLEEATLYSTHPGLLEAAGLAPAYTLLAARCRLQRYGGDCYAYAMLAAGHIDLVVEAGLAPYDIVPLIPLIRAAGGVITDLAGNLPMQGGTVIAAANTTLHGTALAVLRRGREGAWGGSSR